MDQIRRGCGGSNFTRSGVAVGTSNDGGKRKRSKSPTIPEPHTASLAIAPGQMTASTTDAIQPLASSSYSSYSTTTLQPFVSCRNQQQEQQGACRSSSTITSHRHHHHRVRQVNYDHRTWYHHHQQQQHQQQQQQQTSSRRQQVQPSCPRSTKPPKQESSSPVAGLIPETNPSLWGFHGWIQTIPITSPMVILTLPILLQGMLGWLQDGCKQTQQQQQQQQQSIPTIHDVQQQLLLVQQQVLEWKQDMQLMKKDHEQLRLHFGPTTTTTTTSTVNTIPNTMTHANTTSLQVPRQSETRTDTESKPYSIEAIPSGISHTSNHNRIRVQEINHQPNGNTDHETVNTQSFSHATVPRTSELLQPITDTNNVPWALPEHNDAETMVAEQIQSSCPLSCTRDDKRQNVTDMMDKPPGGASSSQHVPHDLHHTTRTTTRTTSSLPEIIQSSIPIPTSGIPLERNMFVKPSHRPPSVHSKSPPHTDLPREKNRGFPIHLDTMDNHEQAERHNKSDTEQTTIRGNYPTAATTTTSTLLPLSEASTPIHCLVQESTTTTTTAFSGTIKSLSKPHSREDPEEDVGDTQRAVDNKSQNLLETERELLHPSERTNQIQGILDHRGSWLQKKSRFHRQDKARLSSNSSLQDDSQTIGVPSSAIIPQARITIDGSKTVHQREEDLPKTESTMLLNNDDYPKPIQNNDSNSFGLPPNRHDGSVVKITAQTSCNDDSSLPFLQEAFPANHRDSIPDVGKSENLLETELYPTWQELSNHLTVRNATNMNQHKVQRSVDRAEQAAIDSDQEMTRREDSSPRPSIPQTYYVQGECHSLE